MMGKLDKSLLFDYFIVKLDFLSVYFSELIEDSADNPVRQTSLYFSDLIATLRF